MPTQAKLDKVAVLKEMLTRAKHIIVTDHTGINVADMTILRRDLRKSNAEMKIAKNTLFKIAAKEAGLEELGNQFSGPTSIVLGYDEPSAPAKIVFDLNKKIEKPKIKGYVLDSQLLGTEDFKKIAQLPPREQVLAMLVGAIDGPIVNFVMTLDAVIRNFIGTIDALAEKRKE
jgi:large subunit ribosomal protein L10